MGFKVASPFLFETIRQTPSLPDAAPRSHRPRCGGRESKFLAASNYAVRAGLIYRWQDRFKLAFLGTFVGSTFGDDAETP